MYSVFFFAWLRVGQLCFTYCVYESVRVRRCVCEIVYVKEGDKGWLGVEDVEGGGEGKRGG